MKTWMFALLESMIALLGLAAYFWADNIPVATTAAVLVAVLGISQSLISAYKKRQLDDYQDRQFLKSLGVVDDQLQELLDGLIDPPKPHNPSVRATLRSCFGKAATQLIRDYEQTIKAIADNDPDADEIAEQFAADVDPWAVGSYLQGLSALAANKIEAAHAHFTTATEAQSSWVTPWLAWATTAYRQKLWGEIRERHPHINGMELLPYDCGDEISFLKLSEVQRQELAEEFQLASTSLGNYYAIAELLRSKDQIADSREEFKKAA
jgi:hypothetical protein